MRQSGTKEMLIKEVKGNKLPNSCQTEPFALPEKKLPVRIPSNQDKAAKLREALNTFIMSLSHRRGNSNYFQSL